MSENEEMDDYDEYEECVSDEDTEDASETDIFERPHQDMRPNLEIKEQMYRDKLANLKEQLRQLENGTHPEYVKRKKLVEQIYQERLLLNDAFLTFETERIENEFFNEQRAAVREFEERKSELKDSLIVELEEKKKMIEAERTTLELATEGFDSKPVTTRKLRRRPNDPVPMPEKRKRGPPATLNVLLVESEINEDLRTIAKSLNASKYNR